MRAGELAFRPVYQHFDEACVADVAQETRRQIQGCGVRFPKDGRIAICVGSRGIASIAEVVRETVRTLQAQGAQPFIIPAMGSHGGATPEGQRAVLAGYGIEERTMGCPVLSDMKVASLGEVEGIPAYMARDAYDADGIIVINRVKPHTDFHGPVESGLMKMLVIGMGKHAQALAVHRHGVRGLRDMIPMLARTILGTGKVLMGIGLVENAYERLRCIRACAGRDIPAADAGLLAMARAQMPSLPVDTLDLLIIDRMGKDISGVGMDTNIIGRLRIEGEAEPAAPHISQIVVDALTEASHGNATGCGLADVITKRLYNSIDHEATGENVRTSGFPLRGRIPPVAKDLAEAVEMALAALPGRTPKTIRAMRIPSTLELSRIEVSAAVYEELTSGPLWGSRLSE